MIPTALCLLFIFFLFWSERARPNRAPAALLVPLAWVFLAGSRPTSVWLNHSPAFASAGDYAEGSPIDAAVFLILTIAGVLILATRRLDWPSLLRKNLWIIVYFLYCLASMAWSEEPAILAKRWIKDLGNPIMALVMLTSPQPYQAVATVLRRLAFLLLPLSYLFIHYYPDLGRGYRPDGSVLFTGVGRQKNDLGSMCLVAGIYVAWEILRVRDQAAAKQLMQHKAVLFVLLFLVIYLLNMSNSQTSLVCLSVAVLIFLIGRAPFLAERPNAIFAALFGAVLPLWALDAAFDLKTIVLNMLGRNPTLTNRTEIWEILKDYEVNSLVGAGFMTFWTGTRMEAIWGRMGVTINQAHNGYLEQYLNLGYVGVALILFVIVYGLLSARKQMTEDPSGGLMRLAFIVCAVLYNYTEASFYGINNMWMLLLLGCIEAPRQPRAAVAAVVPRLTPKWRSGSAIGQR